jgi:hypothetical protein
MVVLKLKVSRKYRRLKQAALKDFAQNVIDSTNNKPQYDVIHDLVTVLAAKTANYQTWLTAAEGGSFAAVAKKDEAKVEVYQALDGVATGLELNGNGTDVFIIEAGMKPHKTPVRHEGDLAVPYEVSVSGTGIGGQLLVIFKYSKEDRSQVTTFAVEYMEENSGAWINGTYENSQRITLKDLPRRKNVKVRLRALGTRGRKSPWTEGEVGAFVL